MCYIGTVLRKYHTFLPLLHLAFFISFLEFLQSHKFNPLYKHRHKSLQTIMNYGVLQVKNRKTTVSQQCKQNLKTTIVSHDTPLIPSCSVLTATPQRKHVPVFHGLVHATKHNGLGLHHFVSTSFSLWLRTPTHL